MISNLLMSIFLRNFGFHPVVTSCPPVVYTFRIRTQWRRAERLKMTVWCEFRSRVFSWVSNVDPWTVHCPNRKQTHWTQSSLRSNTGTGAWWQRVSSVSQACQGCRYRFWRSRRCRFCIWNTTLMCPLSLHLLLHDIAVSPWPSKKAGSLISSLATNTMPEPCPTWKIPPDSLSVLSHEWVSGSKNKMTLSLYMKLLFFGLQDWYRQSRQVSVITDHKEVFDVNSDEPVVLVQLQILQFSRGTLQVNSRCDSHGIKLFPVFRPPTYQEGPSGFLVAEWIALGLTCPGDLCVFKFCLQLRENPFHSEPRAVEEEFFLELLDPFMDAWRFSRTPKGLHAQQIDVVQNDFVVSLSLPKCLPMKGRYIAQFHQCKVRVFLTRGSLSVQGLSSVWVSTVWIQIRFGRRVFLGASVFGLALSRSLMYTAFQVLGKIEWLVPHLDLTMCCKAQYVCSSCSRTPVFLTHSGQEVPSISTHSQCRDWLG